MWFRFLILGLVLCEVSGLAGEPEERRKLPIHPDAAVRQLRSSDQKIRSSVLAALGLEFPGMSEVNDVQLSEANLDSDADLERVLVVKAFGGTAAWVFKQIDGAWWDIGFFICCGPGSYPPEPFVELRPVVAAGILDVVVHSGGKGGTGIGSRSVSVYRVSARRLYKVFDVVESAYDLSGSENARVYYPDPNSPSSSRIIRVDRTSKARVCEWYRWRPDRFSFVRERKVPGGCGQR